MGAPCAAQACINQQDIDLELACLPIFLSGCKTMLIAPGPTYTTRLWCVMELYTYSLMGGDMALSTIEILPLLDVDATPRTRLAAAAALFEKFRPGPHMDWCPATPCTFH